jgi:hypothetical protein
MEEIENIKFERREWENEKIDIGETEKNEIIIRDD